MIDETVLAALPPNERKLLHWSIGHDAPRPPLCVVASPGPPSPALAGRGVYTIRALPDLCGGIVSGASRETQVPLGFLLC